MNILDKVLAEQGLKYEDLNPVEKEFYHKSNFNVQDISIPDLKEKVQQLVYSVSLQLTDTPDDEQNRNTNILLKARLKNYLVLHSFLEGPEKAEQALRNALEAQKN